MTSFISKTIDPLQESADLLVIFCHPTDAHAAAFFHNGIEIDNKFNAVLSHTAFEQEFEGNSGDTCLIQLHEKKIKYVLLMGIGSLDELSMKSWLTISARIFTEAGRVHATTVLVDAENELIQALGGFSIGAGISQGCLLGTYTFDTYKKRERKTPEIGHVIWTQSSHEVERGMEYGSIVSGAVIVARDLVNEPSSVTTPTYLSSFAQSLAKEQDGVHVSVLETSDMKQLGMGGILGIAQGSEEPPKLIKLEYKGGGDTTIALVGKGVTFDSGGLSIKSSEGMETMKIDMAGAAAVLGVFSVLPKLRPKATVLGIIPAVENMPSGKAVKPGDVVKAFNGKTIEIISTDAEGRVILADALSWVTQKEHVDVLIDFATLTGACMVALGEDIAGLFSTNTDLSEALKTASKHSGEDIWELPFFRGYKQLLHSTIADIRNISKTRYGGAITAALFLSEFVPPEISYAHLDIAGPAIAEKDSPLLPVGGTGFGVRLFLEYVRNLTSKA